MTRRSLAAAKRPDLADALRRCASEADIVQVLYANLRAVFGYSAINLQVLEREGWMHTVGVDRGVLQDVRRRPLSESLAAEWYGPGRPVVLHPEGPANVPTRGPGNRQTPRTLVWLPIRDRGETVGSAFYQSYERRRVPAAEIDFLEEVHRQLGALVANAYLNETSRHQSVRLTALNAVARALASTLDEAGVAAALHSTLRQWLPVDSLELAVRDGNRLLIHREPAGITVAAGPGGDGGGTAAQARKVLDTGARQLLEGRTEAGEPPSSAWVPVHDGGEVVGALAIHSQASEAYEPATLSFLEQVAYEIPLALRNARSYTAIEAQRRRLEVVTAVGRRLASSLDRDAIMRALREELALHLEFDLYQLITVSPTPVGPVTEGYRYEAGAEHLLATTPLPDSGPAREAFERGVSLLASGPAGPPRARGSPPPAARAVRSAAWIPVRHADLVVALLSLQSYRANAFDLGDLQLLEDVAAHVSLALANSGHFAAAQTERRRLEALHLLEVEAAGAIDESQVAEALFAATQGLLAADRMLVAHVDPQGELTGHAFQAGGEIRLVPVLEAEAQARFRRLSESARTIAEAGPAGQPDSEHAVWVPLQQGERVVGMMAAERRSAPFGGDEVRLLESTAPVVSIALRTVRLHRANELALAHSVRIQEIAGLAGQDLGGVVVSVADQARTLLAASGVTCWAFDEEGRVTAESTSGEPRAARVLAWSGRSPQRSWTTPPPGLVSGSRRDLAWNLIPLWHGDRLVGALGLVHVPLPIEQPAGAPLDFARHAAIAIENARLAAETRGRIHTLETAAAFVELDITRPQATRHAMGRLIEEALAGSAGALWLIEGDHMVQVTGGEGPPPRMPVERAEALLRRPPQHRLRQLVEPGDPPSDEVFAAPIVTEGRLGGIVTARAGGHSPGETRRLLSVLAGQAAVVLGRLQLVAALDRQARMMNAILSHSPVGVVLEDAGGRVLYANPEVEQLYGVAADRLRGRPAAELVEGAGGAGGDPEAEPGAPLEFRLAGGRGGGGRVVQVRRVAIPGVGEQPAAVLTLHEDVTQERQLLEAKDLMLRAIGHEVRSPAAAMKSTIAGLLQWDGRMAPEQRALLLEEAYEQSDHLLSLVEGQLIIAKLETGRFEAHPVPVELDAALERVLGILRNRYGERAAEIGVRLPERLPPAYCEPTHLDQLLSNLLGNALEYGAAPIEVRAAVSGSWLEVTVADSGPGIPAEQAATLFQKSGPGAQPRARAGGGLGLGLYLCRLVVEQSFGGRLGLAGSGAAGTEFAFTVPAARRAAAGI